MLMLGKLTDCWKVQTGNIYSYALNGYTSLFDVYMSHEILALNPEKFAV